MSTMVPGLLIPKFTVADRLRKARLARHVSSREMARRLGKSVSSILGYENGSIPVRVEIVEDYSSALTVPASWLLTGRDPGPLPPGTPASECYPGLRAA